MGKGVGLMKWVRGGVRAANSRRSAIHLTAWVLHHRWHSHLLPGRSGRGRRRGLVPQPAPSGRPRSVARSRTPGAPY